MTTILTETSSLQTTAANTSAHDLWLDAEQLESASGWTLKPEGMCKDETCVPIPAEREAEFIADKQVNAAAFWRHMNMPIAATETGDIWFLGTDAGTRNNALSSLTAPNFTLPDFSGKLHSLTDFRRQRVLLITWASW